MTEVSRARLDFLVQLTQSFLHSSRLVPRNAERLAADSLARWGPVVRAAGVIGELDGPPPPTVVLSMMPRLEKAYLAAGEQHGQPVELIGRPNLATVQRRPVALDQGHRGVLTVAIQIATGHDPVVGGDDFDLRFFRRGVDEHSVEPAGGGATGELKPVHRPIAGTDVPRPVHVHLLIHALESIVQQAGAVIPPWFGQLDPPC